MGGASTTEISGSVGLSDRFVPMDVDAPKAWSRGDALVSTLVLGSVFSSPPGAKLLPGEYVEATTDLEEALLLPVGGSETDAEALTVRLPPKADDPDRGRGSLVVAAH
jgi:hypothetical protein